MMKRFSLAALLLVIAVPLRAQVPNTDIYLARVTRIGDSIAVGAAINVTHRRGYDNQPSFLPDGSAMLFTVVDSAGRADIWRYDVAARRTTRVTATRESEYSATVMPGGARFSVIRVEQDSTQRLWSFAMDGSDPQLVLANLKPVGYHAWLDSTRLITFVLGNPATLHLINRDGSGDEVRARDIGRALNRTPGLAGSYTFTQRDSLKGLWIYRQSLNDSAQRIAPASPDNEYHILDIDGRVLTTVQGMLVRWSAAAGAWQPLVDLRDNAVKNVSRLALSRDGAWLAFVAEPITP